MKKFLFAAMLFLWFLAPARAQVTHFFLETRAGYEGAAGQDYRKGQFNADYMNLVLEGNIGPSISYYWRQRFTKPLFNNNVPINATDLLYINWDISDRWALQGGKLPIIVGSFEYDDAPIDLYYWNSFCNLLPEVYALGVGAWYNIAPDQQLHLHFTQSPIDVGQPLLFHTGLAWLGGFTSWWKTIWTLNWADDPNHLGACWLALGNRVEAGPLALEMDLMYRHSLQRLMPAADLSGVAKLELSVPYVKVFVKGGVDYNDPANTTEDGLSWDPVIPAGTRYFYGGGGVEVFPLGNEDLRLHAVAWTDNDIRAVSWMLGATFRFRIIKPKNL